MFLVNRQFSASHLRQRLVALGRLAPSSVVKPATFPQRAEAGLPPKSVQKLGALCVCVCLCVLRARSLRLPASCLPSTDPDLPSALSTISSPRMLGPNRGASSKRAAPGFALVRLRSCFARHLLRWSHAARDALSTGDIRAPCGVQTHPSWSPIGSGWPACELLPGTVCIFCSVYHNGGAPRHLAIPP